MTLASLEQNVRRKTGSHESGPMVSIPMETGTLVLPSRRVPINLDRPFAEMVQAGADRCPHPALTEAHFPIPHTQPKQRIATLLFVPPFWEGITQREQDERMARCGLIPEGLPELLAVGEHCSDVLERYMLIAPGSVWRDMEHIPHVPLLYRIGQREVHLYRHSPTRIMEHVHVLASLAVPSTNG